jgi:HAD superfamily hydrolase (TIGR01549 family)
MADWANGLPRVGGERALEAVIFDAGLTLIEVATSAPDVAAEVLTRAGVPFDAGQLALAMAAAEAHVESRWHKGDWWAAESTVRRLFVDGYRHALPQLPAVAADPALREPLAEAIYDAYQDTRHWRLYPDVLPTLRALRAAGLRLGVISDWGHGLEAIVLELQLHDYLEFLVVSSRVGVAKPDPAVFQLALDRIAVAPAHAVYVGDTYVKDVLGARAAGVAPILLDRAGRTRDMDCVVVADLLALLPLLGLGAAEPGQPGV